MQCLALSRQSRVWFSLLLAAGLVAFGLVWLALVGPGQGSGAWPHSPRLTGRQAPELLQPFSPQRLLGGLALDPGDQAARP
ncbi:MAG: hypothetical protein EXR54_00320 [Dehalococcoidia bacterium]|nr:hypothetical protein [Dehalococcoidia bacterium]MSQ16005.1 hypothetical protein [Dehalococcoidia bacterium]